MNPPVSIHNCVLKVQDSAISIEDLEKEITSIPKTEAEVINTMDLSKAVYLQHLPSNLSLLPSVTNLTLNHCHGLIDLSGIEKLKTLNHLTLTRCYTLNNIQGIRSLPIQQIDLSYCSSLLDFRPLQSHTKHLKKLGLGGLFVFHNVPAFCMEMNKFIQLETIDTQDSSISKLIQPAHLQILRCKNILW